MQDRLRFLESVGAFAGLPADALAQIAAGLKERSLAEGEVLFRKGEPATSLFLVAEGRLAADLPLRDGSVVRAEIRDGIPMIGETHAFTSGPRFATVAAFTAARLYELPTALLQSVARDHPVLVARIGEIARLRLQTLKLGIALLQVFPEIPEPELQAIMRRGASVALERGQRLFAEGDPSDAVYILLSGQLCVVSERDGRRRVLNTVSPVEIVGEKGFFTGEPRSASVYAARESELMAASAELFREVFERYPAIQRFVVRTLLRRLEAKDVAASDAPLAYSSARARAGQDDSHRAELRRRSRAVALVPVSEGLPWAEFVQGLTTALSGVGPVLPLDARRLEAIAGIPGIGQISAEHPHASYLTSMLLQVEGAHRLTLYVADPEPSAWTRWCLRRADRVVLVGAADAPARLSRVESELLAGERPFLAPWRTLVLLHRGDPVPGARRHLGPRDVDDHLHLRLERKADFERLARSLTGRTVGVVLSSGGARGCAHIGVLRALEEAGVPVDLIGGTSMGALVAAQHARGLDARAVLEVNRAMWIDSRPFRQLTLPVVSLLSERRIDALYRRFFGPGEIEDLPIPFFCVSSNLTTASAVVHRDGPLWRAVRASSALPGVMVPSIEGGQLLADGGMVNGLPVDVARGLGCGVAIVVNAGPGEQDPVTLERYPTPLAYLRQRWFGAPDGTRPLPGIGEILARSTILSSASNVRRARELADLYLEPPVRSFTLLDFQPLEAIAEAGHRHAAAELAKVSLDALLKRAEAS